MPYTQKTPAHKIARKARRKKEILERFGSAYSSVDKKDKPKKTVGDKLKESLRPLEVVPPAISGRRRRRKKT